MAAAVLIGMLGGREGLGGDSPNEEKRTSGEGLKTLKGGRSRRAVLPQVLLNKVIQVFLISDQLILRTLALVFGNFERSISSLLIS